MTKEIIEEIHQKGQLALSQMTIGQRLEAWIQMGQGDPRDFVKLSRPFSFSEVPQEPFDPDRLESVFGSDLIVPSVGLDSVIKREPETQEGVPPQTIPKSIFLEMLADFRAAGGKFRKSKTPDGGNWHIADDNVVELSPKSATHRRDFRSVIAHELGHSFTLPKDPWDKNSLPKGGQPACILSADKRKNPYDWRYSKDFRENYKRTIYKELNADLEVIRRLKKAGASKDQVRAYAQDALKSIEAYKVRSLVYENSLYADIVGVKKVLLENPETKKSAARILHYKPWLVSDFQSLVGEVSKRCSADGVKLSQSRETLVGELYVEKTKLSNRHHSLVQSFEAAKEKDLLGSSSKTLSEVQDLMEQALEGFQFYRNFIQSNVAIGKVAELEKYAIEGTDKILHGDFNLPLPL